jgi:hypothetical protein
MKNTVIFRDDHAAIVVNSAVHGRFEILVDKSDVHLFHTHKIYVHQKGQDKSFYARFSKNKKNIWLHKYLTNSIGMGIHVHVRHLNGNPLDNRRCNLTLGTARENALDRVVHENLKGYSWNKKAEAWSAQISINNRMYFLGRFKSKDMAAETVRLAREVIVDDQIATRLAALRLAMKPFKSVEDL